MLFFAHPAFLAVEAQAAGVPVIAYGTGGVRDSVVNGETGVFFSEQTVESCAAGILAFEDIERELDDNEQAQQRSQREQDGSEVKSVELERLLAEGLTLIERRNAHEALRDLSADAFELHLRRPWRPHFGSMVSRRTLTVAAAPSL